MNDLISRQAALDHLKKRLMETAINNVGVKADADYVYSEMANYRVDIWMDELPSAQPEIIRCKDCKWWSNDEYRECSSPNYDDGYVTPAGFYCGWAERITDE